MSHATARPAVHATPGLARAIGLPHATAMVVGTIIGASIFVQPSEITGRVPSLSGAALVWGVAGALTLMGALVTAELASTFPESGGVYVYLREAWGRWLGFLWGWAMFWVMHSGIIAAIAMVFADYLAYLVPMGEAGRRWAAVAAILALSAVNYRGVRQGSVLQTAFTAVKVLAIVLIVTLGFALGGPAVDEAAAPTSLLGGGGASDFLLALVAALFAFGGWHMVTYNAEETLAPRRTIPRALALGVLTVTACYVLLNAVYFWLLPLGTVIGSQRIAADAADAVVGRGGGTAMAGLVVFSTFGALAGIVLAGPRVYFAMARDGLLFRWAGALHPRHRTPYRAIALQAAWASVLVLTGTYRALFTRVVYTEWIFFGVMALGLYVLRRRQGLDPRYRVWGYPFTPALFALAAFAIVANQVMAQPVESALGLGMVAAGLPVYAVWLRRARRQIRTRREPRERRLPWGRHGSRSALRGEITVIVDVHSHYFPPEYLDAVRTGPSAFRITQDEEGNPILNSPGDYNVLVPGHRDLDARIADLDRAGVDMQVLTLTAPGTSIETPERAADLAPLVNDGLADAVRLHPTRFTALGHLPMNQPRSAAREMERVVGELGLPGVMLYGNAVGVPLADERFEPVWESANAAGAVVYIHPTYPVGVEAMEDYMLMPLVGFMFDTTLAAAHLVFAGVPDRFPRIRWMLCHAGGAIPWLAERLDRGWRAYPRCWENLARPPSEVLAGFHYDTVNFDPACLDVTLRFAGARRVLAGSDYPHLIGSLATMKKSLATLALDAGDEERVMGGNARELLGFAEFTRPDLHEPHQGTS